MNSEEQEAVPEEELKLAINQSMKKMCRWFQEIRSDSSYYWLYGGDAANAYAHPPMDFKILL